MRSPKRIAFCYHITDQPNPLELTRRQKKNVFSKQKEATDREEPKRLKKKKSKHSDKNIKSVPAQSQVKHPRRKEKILNEQKHSNSTEE